ncbi:MAG: hypothetical protein ACRED9_06225 [Caulobacteraceae bacterium]
MRDQEAALNLVRLTRELAEELACVEAVFTHPTRAAIPTTTPPPSRSLAPASF